MNDTDDLLARIRAALEESEELALQVMVDGLFPGPPADDAAPGAVTLADLGITTAEAAENLVSHGVVCHVPPHPEDATGRPPWLRRRLRWRRQIDAARAWLS